jgi:hypothetical protein
MHFEEVHLAVQYCYATPYVRQQVLQFAAVLELLIQIAVERTSPTWPSSRAVCVNDENTCQSRSVIM